MEFYGIVGNGLRKNLLSCQSPLYFHLYLKFSKKKYLWVFLGPFLLAIVFSKLFFIFTLIQLFLRI